MYASLRTRNAYRLLHEHHPDTFSAAGDTQVDSGFVAQDSKASRIIYKRFFEAVNEWCGRGESFHPARPRLDIYLNHSFKFFGQPRSNNKASGAPQFAPLSTKSQIGSPTIGRTSAVQNPHTAIHKIALRTGFINMRSPSVTSMIPTRNRSVVAGSGAEMPNTGNHSIQACLPPNAKMPRPINSPATAIRKTHSIILVLFIFSILVLILAWLLHGARRWSDNFK